MIEINKNSQITFDYSRCQQCGACLAVCPVNALSYKRLENGLADISCDYEKCINCLKCFKVCPANKVHTFDTYFDDIDKREFSLAYNNNEDVRRNSSSGGVARTLIIESLKNDLVDGVYALAPEKEYPMAKGMFFTKENIPAYNEISNSVYHSVMQCLDLGRVQRCERLMIVGTSCQLRALEIALKGKFKQLIKVCIFCKQQKSLDSTRFLAKIAGTKIAPDLKFTAQYRGTGWPGQVIINGHSVPWHRAAQIPFGRRLWTVPGCNVCGDPFGWQSDADISLMDPWHIRPHNAMGETLMTVNTEAGKQLVAAIDKLTVEPKTLSEVMPALGIQDIKDRQALVPYYRGMDCSRKVRLAGFADRRQRKCMEKVVTTLPKMPMLFYRCLCKLPDLRTLILKS